MTLAAADRRALLPVLDDLVSAVEEIVGAGLAAASQTTVQRLDQAFKEAARLKLNRLAPSLRYANDEIARYVAQSPEFSARRLALFLNRSWVVARGLGKAIRADDEALIGRLMWAPPAPQPLPSIDVVVLGVQKRSTRAAVSFDFRLRQIGGANDGRPLIWSTLYQRKGSDLPDEAWLHTEQAQKFYPKILLDQTMVTVTQVAIAGDDRGGGRLLLGPKATVTPAKQPFADFARLLTWDRASALARVRAHAPSPLDLEVELHEEVVLDGWMVGAPIDRGRPEQRTFPVRWQGLDLDVNVSTGGEGRELAAALTAFRTLPARPPVFGVLHYELCRLMFAPLATLEGGAMRHLMLSAEAIDRQKLVKAMF